MMSSFSSCSGTRPFRGSVLRGGIRYVNHRQCPPFWYLNIVRCTFVYEFILSYWACTNRSNGWIRVCNHFPTVYILSDQVC
jgi:hypothetical protein